ncbi:hypothetical protein FQA39_LY12079 [Lamprigera yunnana]|nr:hypothetical protein FQA39_LY12079 [Lamprigera yunnana]
MEIPTLRPSINTFNTKGLGIMQLNFEVIDLQKYHFGLSEATVAIATPLGAVKLLYFVWRVNGNYGDTAPNGSGMHKRRCVGTP